MARHADGLLDTSAVIGLADLDDSTRLPARSHISAITLAELSVGPLATNDLGERATRQALLQRAEATFNAIPFDADAARAFGKVAASLRSRGKKRQSRAYDALIAAVAIAHALPVYTLNVADFEGIEGLEVVEL